MKIKNIFRFKGVFLYLVVNTFTILSIAPLKAQVKRDHRAKKKEVKVRDHRVTNKTIDKSQTLNFDEADALFGKRTELQRKYPGLKFTGKINRVMITKKLSDGVNPIHKTESGNTIYATVIKGKLSRLSLKNPKIKDVKDGSSNTTDLFNNKTCFKCTKYCHPDHFGNPQPCYTYCVVVDCSKDHNASIPGTIVKGK